jgi:hypothetical protein
MENSQAPIRAKALMRLSRIFHVPVSEAEMGLRFGEDLKATFVSDFRRNELDQINDDIHDVADRTTRKKLARGELTIYTVKDYCDHMIRCCNTNAAEVTGVLDE